MSLTKMFMISQNAVRSCVGKQQGSRNSRIENPRIYQEERWKFAEQVAFCFTMMYFGRKSKSNVAHCHDVKNAHF